MPYTTSAVAINVIAELTNAPHLKSALRPHSSTRHTASVSVFEPTRNCTIGLMKPSTSFLTVSPAAAPMARPTARPMTPCSRIKFINPEPCFFTCTIVIISPLVACDKPIILHRASPSNIIRRHQFSEDETPHHQDVRSRVSRLLLVRVLFPLLEPQGHTTMHSLHFRHTDTRR